MMAGPQWVRSPHPDGGTYVNVTRLTDGRVLCQLCFGYFPRDQLNEVKPGVVEDACKQCAALDAKASRG